VAELAVSGLDPLVWFAVGEHERLGRAALRAFVRADEGLGSIYLPTIVLADFTERLRSGELELENGYIVWEEALFSSGRFFPVDLTREIVRRASRLHTIPDQQDRLLIATALHLGCPLIIPDPERVAASGVVALW